MSSHHLHANLFSDDSLAPCDVSACQPVNGGGLRFCAMLMPAAGERTFRAGEQLADVKSNLTALVAVGAVRTEWNLHDGRRQILDFRFEGDILHPTPAVFGARTVAVTSGTLYRVPSGTLNRCHKWRDDDADWRLRSSENYLERKINQVMMLGRLTAGERVAAFLDDLAERTGVDRDSGIFVALPMGRDDIADYLGLNAETVSRQLSRLRSAGILGLPKPNLAVIRDRDALRELSPFAPLADEDLNTALTAQDE